MDQILVRPQELRQISEQLLTSAQNIGVALQSIDENIRSLKGSQFLGNRANAVQERYVSRRDALLKAKEIVSRFSADLEEAAARFEQADKRNTGQGDLINDPYSWSQFGADVRDAFRVLAPYTESEAAEYLKKTPAGQSLLDDLVSAKIKVQLPDGTQIGYQGEDGKLIVVKQGESIGGGNYRNGVITIPNGIWERARSKEDLASILAHEIQHAYDDEAGLMPGLVSVEELKDYFSKSPEQQDDIRSRLANELESHVDSEIRAYERSDSMKDGSGYDEDGVMSAAERQSVLDKQLEWSRDYEKHYEESLSKTAPGMEFDVSLDEHGELKVTIKQAHVNDDDWWPLW